MFAQMVVLALLSQGAPSAWSVFRAREGWMLAAPNGATSSVNSIDGLPVSVLAVSADGQNFAFTSAQSAGLFVKLGSAPATAILTEPGYCGWPEFSADGQTLIFDHAPGPGAGPIGGHMANMNGQVWTVDLRSRNVKKLTDSRGCKGKITSSGSVLLFAHNTCDGQQGLDLLDLSTGKLRTVVEPSGYADEPRFSPDGRRFAYLVRWRGQTLLRVANSKPPFKQLAEVIVGEGELQALGLTWSRNSKKISYWNGVARVSWEVDGR